MDIITHQVKNPCRNTVFEVLGIDKSETEIREIRRAIQHRRDELKYGSEPSDAAGGVLTEAELNAMQAIILDPVSRLKAERFEHQRHRHSDHAGANACLVEMAAASPSLRERLLAFTRRKMLMQVVRWLPEMNTSPVHDDLPWPDYPTSARLDREPLNLAILRDV